LEKKLTEINAFYVLICIDLTITLRGATKTQTANEAEIVPIVSILLFPSRNRREKTTKHPYNTIFRIEISFIANTYIEKKNKKITCYIGNRINKVLLHYIYIYISKMPEIRYRTKASLGA
jgi:hypothetical protein